MFDNKDIGIDILSYSSKISSFYSQFESDSYLLHKQKIDYLFKNNFLQVLNYDFDFSTLDLDKSVKEHLDSLKSNRKRLISSYDIVINNHIVEINRVKNKNFVQSKSHSLEISDYRLLSRKFKELPDEMFDENLRKIIEYIFLQIKKFVTFSLAHLSVHHTLMECIDGKSATNSPEGIHQDGMDFIVSAFVLESKNIGGGQSIVYLEDKKTQVFQITLKSGQGILQPDNNSPLWHEVTPIYPLDKNLPV